MVKCPECGRELKEMDLYGDVLQCFGRDCPQSKRAGFLKRAEVKGFWKGWNAHKKAKKEGKKK